MIDLVDYPPGYELYRCTKCGAEEMAGHPPRGNCQRPGCGAQGSWERAKPQASAKAPTRRRRK